PVAVARVVAVPPVLDAIAAIVPAIVPAITVVFAAFPPVLVAGTPILLVAIGHHRRRQHADERGEKHCTSCQFESIHVDPPPTGTWSEGKRRADASRGLWL